MGPDADSSRQGHLKEILRKTVLPLTDAGHQVREVQRCMNTSPKMLAAQQLLNQDTCDRTSRPTFDRRPAPVR